MKMTNNKPYLIRAIYEWIVDNSLTPYLAVNANYPGVDVPQEHVHNGRIILNVSPDACRGLLLENDRIIFTARFSNIALQIFLPPAAVFAIYAQENGRGMEFGSEYDEEPPPAAEQSPKGSTQTANNKGRNKHGLTLVKKE